MAVRNPTMSLYNSDETSERWHLLRRVFILLLLVIALSLGLVILFRQRNNVPLLLFNILADASLGLIIGLGTRFVLRQMNGFIQGVASAAMVVIGLAVLGYFTNWRTGIGPLQVGLINVDWLNWAQLPLKLPLFTSSKMDMIDLAQMVIGIDTAWVALRAWKSSPRVVGQYSSPAPRVRSRTRARSARASVTPSASASNNHASASASSRPRVKKKKSGRPVISMRTADPKPSRSRAWNPMRKRPELQIAVYEEHRCPYCLEIVTRNDPRGSVECQVCHALHHKDCWDITGSCQVPHLNT
jgi:hypothetical protein